MYSENAGGMAGLSPRGRGKHIYAPQSEASWRSIPAWAGETPKSASSAASIEVYPRVGGGNVWTKWTMRAAGGLSPRGRGKLSDMGQALQLLEVYPRVGGGNWNAAPKSSEPGRGLSPRGRGKHGRHFPTTPARRSIPAWAGETCGGSPVAFRDGVYPRVGGGNILLVMLTGIDWGLSPRGRGKRRN